MKRIGFLLIGVLMASGCSTQHTENKSGWPEMPDLNRKAVVLKSDKVLEVRDGDTLRLQGRGVVKIGGANIPSLSNFGNECGDNEEMASMNEEAYEFTKELVDRINDRNLWVKVKDFAWTDRKTGLASIPMETPSGLTVSEELIKNGYAIAFPKSQFNFNKDAVKRRANAYEDSLYSLQEKAEREGLGLWKTRPAVMRCMKSLTEDFDK